MTTINGEGYVADMISETTTTAGGEGALRSLETALRFQRCNIEPTITECTEYTVALQAVRSDLDALRAANKRLTGLLEKIVATNLLTLADSGSLQDEARAALTSNAAAAANGEME